MNRGSFSCSQRSKRRAACCKAGGSGNASAADALMAPAPVRLGASLACSFTASQSKFGVLAKRAAISHDGRYNLSFKLLTSVSLFRRWLSKEHRHFPSVVSGLENSSTADTIFDRNGSTLDYNRFPTGYREATFAWWRSAGRGARWRGALGRRPFLRRRWPQRACRRSLSG